MTDSEKLHFEDFAPGTVREFGGVTVTADEIVAFARRFDPQPFHLDESAGRASHFGGLVASGWHTCAMAMRMYCDAVLLRAEGQGSPGIEKLRWLEPVRPGDVLRVRIQVLDARPSATKPTVGLVRSRWEVLNQSDDVVLEMEAWGMFRRRAA